MSKYSIYFKAYKCLEDIKFFNFPKLEDNNNNLPYSEGPFISSPIINYLKENKIYNSYGSGAIEDYGILIKTFADIQTNKFVRIQTIDANNFKITWIVEDVDELLAAMLSTSDFDWRVFDKLGFTSKSKIIEIKFNFSDNFYEKPDESIISTGIIDYNKLKKKIE